MAGIKHAFTSAKADSSDTTLVRPTNWNADHVITGDVQFSGFNIDTTGTTFDITLDTAGTPLTALTLGTTDIVQGTYAHVFDVGNNDFAGLTVQSSNASANGPFIQTYFNSASPAASDFVGGFYHTGRNTTPGNKTYGAFETYLIDPTASSEDTELKLSLQSGGSFLTALTLGGQVEPSFGIGGGHLIDFGSQDYGSLTLKATSAATNGPVLTLYHQSASPANYDYVATIAACGRDNANNDQFYGNHTFQVTDVTSTLEDSQQVFQTLRDGVTNNTFVIGGVWSPSGAYACIIDLSTASQPNLVVQNSDAGAGGPQLNFFQDSASPASFDQITNIIMSGRDSGGNFTNYSNIQVQIGNATDGSERATMYISNIMNGTMVQALGLNSVDPITGQNSHVFDFSSASDNALCLKGTNAGAQGPYLMMYHGTASPAAADVPGKIAIYGKDSASNNQAWGAINCVIDDATSTSEDSYLGFDVMVAGTLTTAIILKAGTTASAANAFIDNAASNELKRSTSAGRYKRNVVGIDGGSASKILSRLRPVRYQSAIAADPQDVEYYGLIAEEVAAVDPGLVHFIGENRDVPDGVQYDRLPVILLSAFGEQERRIAELETKLKRIG